MVLATALVSGCVCSYRYSSRAEDPEDEKFKKSYKAHREFMIKADQYKDTQEKLRQIRGY